MTRCQACGSPVRVVSSDEGTSYYEPLGNDMARAIERLIGAIEAIVLSPGRVSWKAVEASQENARAALRAWKEAAP